MSNNENNIFQEFLNWLQNRISLPQRCEQHLKNFEIFTDYVNNEFQNINSKLNELNNNNQNDFYINNDFNSKKDIENLNNRITNLEIQHEKDQEEIKKLNNKVTGLEKALKTFLEKDVKSKVELSKKNDNYIDETKIPNKEVKTSQETKINIIKNPVNKIFDIQKFVLTGNENAYLIKNDTSKNDVQNYFQKALDISNIINTLHTMSVDISSYEKVFNQYIKDLNFKISKFDYDECIDEDELSEKVIGLVQKEVKNSIIEKVISAISRKIQSHKSDSIEFEKLLSSINEYLHGLGYYTREVLPERLISPQDEKDMDFIPTPCQMVSQHNLIQNVETLPYYINYIDYIDNNSMIVCRGKCIVYSSKLK